METTTKDRVEISTRSGHFKEAFAALCFASFIMLIAPAAASAQEPVLINLGTLIRDTSYGSCCDARYRTGSYSVPQGKMLVIEQVLLELHTPAAKATGHILVTISTPNSGSFDYYPFVFTNQGTDSDGKTILTASQPMKLYVINPASSGKKVKVSLYITPQDNGRSSGEDAALSGILKDAP